MTVRDLLTQVVEKCWAKEMSLDDTVYYFSGSETIEEATVIERVPHLRKGETHGVELYS